MSCVLRITGNKKLKINKLLQIIPELDTYWIKGEPRLSNHPNGKKHLHTGANHCISDAGFDNFELQKKDAINYLITNRIQIIKIQELKGLKSLYLDFGIEQRDVAMQCDSFPPKLIKLAGELNLGIEISLYP